MIWDANKEYEYGVDHGVLYPLNGAGVYKPGVPWSGLQSVNENPTGSEPSAFFADNIKYANILSNEEYAATIEAYTYPDEFEECDGSASIGKGVKIGQQARKPFGLSYRTMIGNESNQEAGYKLHLVYGCLAAPSDRDHSTVNDSPDIASFSWEVSTTPVAVTGKKPTATVEIDSTTTDADKLAAIERILYGVDALPFDASKTYAVGDFVTHTESSVEKTYKCTTAVEVAGEWDASDWTESDENVARLPLPDELASILAEG